MEQARRAIIAYSQIQNRNQLELNTTQSEFANNVIPHLNNKDILLGYCKEQQKENPVDYYIFGHNHTPTELTVDPKATYFNTGDWLSHNTYATLYNGKITLKTYNK